MPPGEGVGPVHSRGVPLPLTRGEIGSPLTDGNGFPYAEGWRLRHPMHEAHMSKALLQLRCADNIDRDGFPGVPRPCGADY